MNAGVLFQMTGGKVSGTEMQKADMSRANAKADDGFKATLDKAVGGKRDVSPKTQAGKAQTDNSKKPKEDVAAEKVEVLTKPVVTRANAEKPQQDQPDMAAVESPVVSAAQIQQVIMAVMNAQNTQNMWSVTETREKSGAGSYFEALAGIGETKDMLSEIMGEEGKIKLDMFDELDFSDDLKSLMNKELDILGSKGDALKDTLKDMLMPKQVKDYMQQAAAVTSTEEPVAALEEVENVLTAETEEDGKQEVRETVFSLKTNHLDPSKVNIKVAEAPVDTTRADVAKQIMDKVMYKAQEGRQEFDLELYPKHLGKINIKMIFQNGTAEMMMTTTNSKAHQLLSNQVDALRAILEGNTGLDSSVNVKQAEEASQQFDRDNFQQESQKQQGENQRREREQKNETNSFVERLRLGMIDGLEEAV